MARSTRDTLIYATILLAPMVTAAVYMAGAGAPIVVVTEAPGEPCPAPAAVDLAVVPEPPAPPAPPAPVEPAAALPADHAGAGMLMYQQHLVLRTAPDLTWSKGQLKALGGEGEVTVTKKVDATRLPAELQPLVDARVIVYAADGSACTASTAADKLSIYASQTGELNLLLADDASYLETGEISKAAQLELNKHVFSEAQLLRARLTREAGRPACDGLWARAAELPAAAVFGGRPLDEAADAELTARLKPLLAVHPEIVELRAAYAEHIADEADAASWDEAMFTRFDITRWDEVGGPRSFVNVVVGDGGEACSSLFSEQIGVLFTLAGDTLTPHPDPGFLAPLALMDLERDGHLEAVTGNGFHLESRGPAETLQSFEIPYHGCPC